MWARIFADHHYLSKEFNSAARLFLVYFNNTLVAMTSVLPVPSGTIKYAFRVHRLVVLPDYQNLNIGTKLNEAIAKLFVDEGNKFFIRTSHIRLYNSLIKNKKWVESSSSGKPSGPNGGKMKLNYDLVRPCYSFEYRGEDYVNKEHKELVIKNKPEVNDDLKEKLLKLKEQYYLTIIYGNAANTDDFEHLVKSLGIRTEILYVNKKGVLTIKNKYKNRDDKI